MKNILTLIFIVFTLFQANTQLAPDFTVTDSKGNQHQLYSDYLDQGKTVVLELFFIECPPCNTIAPYVETLYQDWGAGTADVEFIKLTTSSNSTNNNAGVLAYQNSKNLTFVGVGNNGGSLDAVQPYKTNTFGSYTGTPSFVIIAPDKTVQYNPSPGSSPTNRMAAINQAIINTGAEGVEVNNPPTTYNVVLGNYDVNDINTAYLQNGDGSNQVELSLSNLNISLPDESLYPGITDPHIVFDIVEDADEGLNVQDVIMLQQHILTKDVFTNPLSYIAGDLNADDKYNVGDIINLIKIILKKETTLPSGLPLHRFISDDCPANDPSCLNGVPLSGNEGTTNQIQVDVVKMGNISVLD